MTFTFACDQYATNLKPTSTAPLNDQLVLSSIRLASQFVGLHYLHPFFVIGKLAWLIPFFYISFIIHPQRISQKQAVFTIDRNHTRAKHGRRNALWSGGHGSQLLSGHVRCKVGPMLVPQTFPLASQLHTIRQLFAPKTRSHLHFCYPFPGWLGAISHPIATKGSFLSWRTFERLSRDHHYLRISNVGKGPMFFVVDTDGDVRWVQTAIRSEILVALSGTWASHWLTSHRRTSAGTSTSRPSSSRMESTVEVSW